MNAFSQQLFVKGNWQKITAIQQPGWILLNKLVVSFLLPESPTNKLKSSQAGLPLGDPPLLLQCE